MTNPDDCLHRSISGDNYGETCNHCGKQISGYGYGGPFGVNITGKETCIHFWVGFEKTEVCFYCDEMRSLEAPRFEITTEQ